MRRRFHRSRSRGASMVEAIVVISVFILFFVGMVYFESLYHEQLRVQQLARAAAVAYAMNACPDDVNALQTVQQDLHTATGASGQGPQPTKSATVGVSSNQQIGNKGGDPIGGGMKQGGFTGDKVTDITLNGKAGASTKGPGLFSARWGFRQDVVSNSYMSCGDPQKDGDPAGMWDMVSSSFPLKPP